MVEKKPEQKKTEQKKPETKTAVIKEPSNEPKPTFEKQYLVARVGWNDENPHTPIVLLDKKERNLLQIDTTAMVKVKKVGSDKTSIAIVQVQFKELVGREVATLNTCLATKIGAGINDKVEIVKGVLESEAQGFRQSLLQNQREVFMTAMATDMGF